MLTSQEKRFSLRTFFSLGRCNLGVRVMLVSTKKHILPYSFTLTQSYFNYVAEYQALKLGLQMRVMLESLSNSIGKIFSLGTACPEPLSAIRVLILTIAFLTHC